MNYVIWWTTIHFLLLDIFNIKSKYFQRDHTWWTLRNTKYYAFDSDFQERGSTYVHSLFWIFNAPNIHHETAYIGFIENKLNASFWKWAWLFWTRQNLSDSLSFKKILEIQQKIHVFCMDGFLLIKQSL